MRLTKAKALKSGLSVLGVAFLCACSTLEPPLPQPFAKSDPLEVGFYAGGSLTKTAINPDGLSASWVAGDRIALWAKNSAGAFSLSNQAFTTYGADRGFAYFSTTLGSTMPEDSYTYYACHPVPTSTSGTLATFHLPSTQNGKAGNGADILIATPATYGALRAKPEVEDHSGMSLRMNHVLHQMRFFVPSGEDRLSGEKIEKILLTFPRSVVGTISADVADPAAAVSLSEGSSTITLTLSEQLAASSSASDIHYACAAIAPTSFEQGETFSIKVYSQTLVGTADPVDLKCRTFEGGHSTPVKILLTNVHQYGRLRVTLAGNNLGEPIQSITLTAPSGCKWPTTGSNVCTFSGGIEVGESYEFIFDDMAEYRKFSSQTIAVNFDSEHVNTTVNVAMPNMSSGTTASFSATAPWLLYEDFSTVGSFSEEDEYKTSSLGAHGPYSFLNGWTGGRIGAEAGHCIRIGCRRETSADYDARVDSAPIIPLKKAANLSVVFDYGNASKFLDVKIGSLVLATGDVGMTYKLGYSTSADGYASNSTDGTFEGGDNDVYTHEQSGSYTSTPYPASHVLHNVPTGTVRIAWRAEIEHHAGTTNTTAWLYIDNVRVQIAQ